MALNGHEISGDVYAWAAVFILPINSALNPILYTLSAIVGQKVSSFLLLCFCNLVYVRLLLNYNLLVYVFVLFALFLTEYKLE